MRRVLLKLIFACALLLTLTDALADDTYARDPRQPVDAAYTQKIKQYTTDPAFLSPLVEYLPAGNGVPTPAEVLGDVSGAPNTLPHSKEVYAYFRLLAEKSPRVKVFSIG